MLLPGAPPSFIITTIRGGPFFTDHLKVRVLSYFCFNNLRGKAMANYPQELAQDAVCQSHTGHMTGLWFLPTRPLRLNSNEWTVKGSLMMDPLWSETCWITFKYFIILIVSTYYILCISWIIKCLMYEGFFPWTNRWGVMTTTHFHLLSRLKISGAIPPIPVHAFMACTGA